MSRKKAEEQLKNKGATIVKGVTKDLNILIVGDKPGSKLAKANTLNESGASILILSEEDCLQKQMLSPM